MPFDHGQRRIAPLSIVLMIANVFVWRGDVPTWVLVVAVVIAVCMTGDPYAGMFIATLLLAVALAAGITTTRILLGRMRLIYSGDAKHSWSLIGRYKNDEP